MSRVRWGILSTADIGVSRVIPATQRARNGEVVAIASRRLATATAAAARLDIPTAYGSYDDLLASPDIDAVYIPLPNDMHVEWVIRAAEARKHVLCEKPLAMSVAQATEMVRACEDAGVKLQEAFMYRHHPQWVETVRLVTEGRIGDLVAVQSWFSYFNDDPTNIRNRSERGGGATMDIGCYSINLARMLFREDPVRVASVVHRENGEDVDTTTSAALGFPGGGQSAFTCSMRAQAYQRVHVVGTEGRIEIEVPFNPSPDDETRIFVFTDASLTAEPDTVVFPPVNQYTIQAELFAQAILDDTPVPVPASDAIANARVVELILASSGSKEE